VTRPLRITTRNATFQLWEALLTNRTKRLRSGSFLVQGVRPLTLAIRYGWTVQYLLSPAGVALSSWAQQVLDETPATPVEMAPELLRELGHKSADVPELLAVVAMPPDDLDRIAGGPDFLGVLFDRPTSPGNLGTLVRSADAFGASGVLVSGHAADPYDPKAVRASTGSLFAVPVVRVAGADPVLEWVERLRAAQPGLSVVGTDEEGDCNIEAYDWRRPSLVVVGNETGGMSRAWREAADVVVSIPITGGASSLNAAAAGTVLLYEAARQRRTPG
jgi:tRNA G18 (ribose-2'-O)-methylase SpoU